MSAIEALIAALETTIEPSRRLDALATGWALAPPGWRLDPVEDIDGWAILTGAPASNLNATWMCAADVCYVTRYMDAAMELIIAACPEDAAAISTRAFSRLMATASRGDDPGAFVQRTACQMVAELLRAIHNIGEVGHPLERAA